MEVEKSINEQQILFINSLFNSTQKEPIMVKVVEKHTGRPYNIEVVPGRIIAYRIHLPEGVSSLWSDFVDEDDIRNKFRIMSL